MLIVIPEGTNEATIVDSEALMSLVESGKLKVGDSIYSVIEKRTIEAQPPIRISEPTSVEHSVLP